ncbi:MAG: DUF1538 domain-containing protein [Sphaerochaeta sp.]|jgi:hypothetical protein|uniref:DUF1538 domain-containing protein n=1 Tax=Sphaerochaeta sp. TaxID=1972642 RepID=UPI002A3708C2|nr:DUF1538 domain-containing protein [Sphaerochaeta sp.]MCK9599213.1 DUF1538 domain-containing protein [Sphaerochaeta sp.]MDX9825859.1 DUF1538 domain-containing protein [Sphaerochaeta sp.]
MELLKKLKEVGSSIIPILALVALMHFFITPLPAGSLTSFIIGGFLLIAGLSLFLLGVDIGLLPIGERIGSAATRSKHLLVLLGTGFLVGVVIILAEPNIAVLAEQVKGVNPSISKTSLVSMIAIGVGFYLMVGMVRVVFHLSLRLVYLVSYALLFILFIFSPIEMMGIAFDAGGAATGPLSVPFIMAIGIGIARVQKKQNDADNFGYVSLALIGPTFALGILGLFNDGGAASSGEVSVAAAGNFLSLIQPSLAMTAQALVPLLLLCLFYQFLLLKMPLGQLVRMVTGFVYLFIGLTLFFMGSNGGFIPVGYQIGYAIGTYNRYLLLLVGVVIGAITVLSEPSVWVLVNQVQEITQGHIKKPLMLVALAIGVGLSLFLAMIRVITGLAIWYFVLPTYALAVFLSFFVPDLFVGLSFDSGSVSSGPMASTFILAFAIGSSVSVGGNPLTDAFGVILFVSMTPVVIVELLGLVYKRTQKKMAASKGGKSI